MADGRPNILVICGPTASGKTALAAELALRFDGEVVSADSMQVYRGLDIGTAKPNAAEKRGVPHHMLDVADPWESYSVARYVSEAVPIVDDILARGRLPIVAGGTGLYIDALIAGREFAALPSDPALRAALQERARSGELSALAAELAGVDPGAAARIHPNDEKRIIRALEVWHATGKTISRHDAESRALPDRYAPLTIGLSFARRPDLWARVDRRVDVMMEQGLAAEVEGLLRAGIPPRCTAMQAIGYKEMAAALREGRPPREGAEEIKLRSRQYAKRQLTWFRRREDTRWFLWDGEPDFSAAAAFSTDLVRTHGLG